MHVCSFEDGLQLVKLRGESMQAAADTKPSAMVSVIGLSSEKVITLNLSASLLNVNSVEQLAFGSCTQGGVQPLWWHFLSSPRSCHVLSWSIFQTPV